MDKPAPGLLPELESSGAQARIEEKTLAGEHLQRAHVLRPQKNVASPIANHFVATGIFHHTPAAPDLLPERGGIESPEAGPAIAGESDFMSTAQYFPQHIGQPLRRPWVHEESCTRAGLSE